MPRTKSKVCTVSGIKTSENNFYKGHNHVKAVDNFRRVNGFRVSDVKNLVTLINS